MSSPQNNFHLVSDDLRFRAGILKGMTASKKRLGDIMDKSTQAKRKRMILGDENNRLDKKKNKQSGVLVLSVPGPRLQEIMERLHEKERRQHLIKTGAEKMGSSCNGPVFHLFTLLPKEIRLQIWTLLNPEPARIMQYKGLGYRPLATFMEPRPTPAVLHICHESRNEYLYREDDDANQATTRGHNLYRRCFQDTNDNMSFISFEVDEVCLFSFKIAEKVARDNLKTLVIGPQERFISPFWAKFRQRNLLPNTPRLLPPHKLCSITYINEECGCAFQRLWKIQEHDSWNFGYDFKDLRDFPSLEKIVVLLEDEDLADDGVMDDMVKMIAVAISTAQVSYPGIKTPIVGWSTFEAGHTCEEE